MVLPIWDVNGGSPACPIQDGSRSFSVLRQPNICAQPSQPEGRGFKSCPPAINKKPRCLNRLAGFFLTGCAAHHVPRQTPSIPGFSGPSRAVPAIPCHMNGT